jgi:molybdopterin synthase catalytic subunit
MRSTWPVRKVALLHRIGALDVGETSVLVACSAPHRAEAFEACRHGIERLKQDVPIWKKEGLATGEAHWVMGS